jgi:hypothetical protein
MPKHRSTRLAERQTLIALCLRKCALEVDPRQGLLKTLAEHVEMHVTTLSMWTSQGYIPRKSARMMQRKFGKKLANAEILSEKP